MRGLKQRAHAQQLDVATKLPYQLDTDRQAVRSGLASSAKVIAAAAIIMISVFGSFILNGDPTIKQFGVGLSVAVLLASAMVLSLAPAMLTLFGRAVWWLPGWLSRLLPRVDIEGGPELPTQGPAAPPPHPAISPAAPPSRRFRPTSRAA